MKRKDKATRKKASPPPWEHRFLARWAFAVPFVFAFVLYGNTIAHDYALDDGIITRQNEFVQMGVAGIPKIFAKGFLFGFNRTNDQSYRPLTLANMAVEKELFGNNPHVHHFFNVLWYALTGVFLFLLLRRLPGAPAALPLIVTLLYLSHPVHTEVVANIKSRDEILAFFFAVVSLYLLIRHSESKSRLSLAASVLAFFAALLAKESIITFVAVVPLFGYFFCSADLKRAAVQSAPFVAAAGLYLALRSHVLSSMTFEGPLSIVNNSLMAAQPGAERLATTIYTLGKYASLLVIPHPLSWDYSYRQIPPVGFGDVRVVGSALLYILLVAFALFQSRRKSWIAFGVLFYIATLSVSSNLFIKIGSSMGERFLYTPSLGYCIALASVLLVVVNKVWPAPGQQRAAVLAGAAGVIILLFSLKTITRNSVWGNNFALFSSGVETAPLSARAHQALAYAYTEKAQAEPEKKPQHLAAALAEYRKALAILPEYSEAWHNLGWTHFLAGNFDEAERAYKKAIEIEPGYAKTYNNLGALSFERKQYDEALRYFLRANEADPDFPDTLGNIGTVYHILGKDAEAARYYKRALGINPNIETVRRNLEAVERALAQPGK